MNCLTSWGVLRFIYWQIRYLFAPVPSSLEVGIDDQTLWFCSGVTRAQRSDQSSAVTGARGAISRDPCFSSATVIALCAWGAEAPNFPRPGSRRLPVTSFPKRIPDSQQLVSRGIGVLVCYSLSTAREGSSRTRHRAGHRGTTGPAEKGEERQQGKENPGRRQHEIQPSALLAVSPALAGPRHQMSPEA